MKLLLAVLAMALSATAAGPKGDGSLIPGADELLFGFDAVKGITLAQLTQLTYSEGKKWTHPLRPLVTYVVPDQVQVHEDAIEETTDTYEDTLQEWVKTKALGFGLPAKYMGFLGLSLDFQHAQEQYLTQHKAFHERKELLGFFRLTPVPDSFTAKGLREAATRLPASCDNEDQMDTYVKFMESWGTHYIKFIRMGGFMHQTAEFTSETLAKIDRNVLSQEIDGAWEGFTVGASAKQSFESDQYTQTNHTTVHFVIDGGNIYKKYQDMEDWKDTVPENPAVITRHLGKIYDLLEPVGTNTECFDRAERLYYALNINPKRVTSSKVDTFEYKQSDQDLKVVPGYLMSGLSIDFGGTCRQNCIRDGPMIKKIGAIGHNFYGYYEPHEAQNVSVEGKKFSPQLTTNFECPDNTYIAGVELHWAGNCKGHVCKEYGWVLGGMNLLCRTPHVAAGVRQLSDPSETAVPDMQRIRIGSAQQTKMYGECPDDSLVESVTVKIASPCKGFMFNCHDDGSIITGIDLNCRSLKDFVF